MNFALSPMPSSSQPGKEIAKKVHSVPAPAPTMGLPFLICSRKPSRISLRSVGGAILPGERIDYVAESLSVLVVMLYGPSNRYEVLVSVH